MRAHRISPTMPESDEGTPRVQGTREVPKVIGQLVSIRRRIDDEHKASAEKMHKLAAPVAALVYDGYGKDIAAAERIGESKQYVSDQRAGTRGMMLWQLVVILADSPEAFEAFCRPFCEVHDLEPPQAKRALTYDELAELALGIFAASPMLLKSLAREAEEKYGAGIEEVARALMNGSRK